MPGDLTTDLSIFLNQFITGALTVAPSGALTSSAPGLSITQTWNNAGVTFTGALVNVTDTASAAASMLMDLKVGSVSKFYIDKVGSVNGAGTILLFSGKIQANGAGTAFKAGDVGASIGWNDDCLLYRDGAANTLALRNSTAAQEFRPYGYYVSTSSRTYGVVKCATGSVTLSGASTATSNIIPAGSFVIGVATTTTTTITGATGYTVGDGSDVDRWGDITGTAVGTSSDNTNSTANPTGYFAAASAVTLTAKTSNFTGGVVQVTVFYLTTGAD